MSINIGVVNVSTRCSLICEDLTRLGFFNEIHIELHVHPCKDEVLSDFYQKYNVISFNYIMHA